MWDERVSIHVDSAFYDVAGWKAGNRNHLVGPFEEAEIGPVDGKRLCHLQCHFGMDTLTFARRGATVVGVDFSGAAVDAARALARDVGLDATTQGDDGMWRLPDDPMPLSFSLQARAL